MTARTYPVAPQLADFPTAEAWLQAWGKHMAALPINNEVPRCVIEQHRCAAVFEPFTMKRPGHAWVGD
jgi:hypothetical protein